jgi:hypothetical protein
VNKWWNQRPEALLDWAIALDNKLGEIEMSLHTWWAESFAVWPPSDRPKSGQMILERAIDSAEWERIERAHRFAAMMTKGRWR